MNVQVLHRGRPRRNTVPVKVPDVQYAKSGDVNIAYKVTGEGPFDLVFVPGYVTHLELHWAIPSFAPFLERLSSFSRLIRFDKRGTGMSDGVRVLHSRAGSRGARRPSHG